MPERGAPGEPETNPWRGICPFCGFARSDHPCCCDRAAQLAADEAARAWAALAEREAELATVTEEVRQYRQRVATLEAALGELLDSMDVDNPADAETIRRHANALTEAEVLLGRRADTTLAGPRAGESGTKEE